MFLVPEEAPRPRQTLWLSLGPWWGGDCGGNGGRNNESKRAQAGGGGVCSDEAVGMLPHGGREMDYTMRGGGGGEEVAWPSWRRTIRQEGGGGQREACRRQTTGRHNKRVEVYGIVDGGSWSLEVNWNNGGGACLWGGWWRQQHAAGGRQRWGGMMTVTGVATDRAEQLVMMGQPLQRRRPPRWGQQQWRLHQSWSQIGQSITRQWSEGEDHDDG